MFTQIKNRNFYIMFGLDLFLFGLAHVGSYLIRFEFQLSANELNNMISVLAFIIAFKAVVFYCFGLYRGMWRYAGMSDLRGIYGLTVEGIVKSTIALLKNNEREKIEG